MSTGKGKGWLVCVLISRTVQNDFHETLDKCMCKARTVSEINMQISYSLVLSLLSVEMSKNLCLASGKRQMIASHLGIYA